MYLVDDAYAHSLVDLPPWLGDGQGNLYGDSDAGVERISQIQFDQTLAFFNPGLDSMPVVCILDKFALVELFSPLAS